MNTKHTPGPWHSETITGRHKVWADSGLNEDQAVIATVDTSANARLIAAAPDLLAVINEIWESNLLPRFVALEHITPGQDNIRPEHWGDPLTRKVAVAIAKATGNTL